MKLWLLISVFFPLVISGSTIDSIVKNKQDDISLDSSLSIFAEFSPDRTSRNTHTLLTIYGRVGDGFHIYSIHPQGDFAPEPTHLKLETPVIREIGPLQESKPATIIDEAFRLPLKVHKNEFWLRQKCSVSKDVKQGFYEIRGYIQFQVCNNRICSLPLKKYFQEQLLVE